MKSTSQGAIRKVITLRVSASAGSRASKAATSSPAAALPAHDRARSSTACIATAAVPLPGGAVERAHVACRGHGHVVPRIGHRRLSLGAGRATWKVHVQAVSHPVLYETTARSVLPSQVMVSRLGRV